MKVGSLCSGYDGLALSLGVEPVWVSDIDPGACRILAHRYPDAPNLGDLTTVDWKEVDTRMKNELAQEMYDRYCQGLSLAEVGKEFGRSRQSVFKMFSRRGWDMRPRPPARPMVEFGGRKFTLGNLGYYRATDGDRELMHRFVWAYYHGPIPGGHDIHHIDHDKTNNDPANLECMSKAEHTRRHAKEVVPSDSSALDVLVAGYP